MEIELEQKKLLFQKRKQAARKMDEWRKRNADHLKNWNPIEALRAWREKRWSSSTHQ